MFLEELLTGRHLLVSYYYSVNVAIISSIARELSRRGFSVCIVNLEKMRFWERVEVKCEPGARVLVFDAESESEVPQDYLLVTSTMNLNLEGVKRYKIKKVQGNIYRAEGEATYYFKVNQGRVEDYELSQGDLLVDILRELGGEATLKDLVNIYSHRSGKGREKVREELGLLARLGKIEIRGGKVRLLNDYGWSEG
ncbi:MAG: hypothetical protein RXS23_00910 [Metallosphaera yellowstonensis]|jgi:hypothetical protein|uniref:Uncharacterized protein n=1 Tax=Metallosphaera yellowstonensis MK1 TaxID=671065 RepID=H2C9D3_9CREN|nr:hypothetical protein [Metallosphaera yellowstonensis]EHP68759.1 hypothetical protein MetMK1DRAFT_00032040 [Metallosphaera yellowstonensis MK1]